MQEAAEHLCTALDLSLKDTSWLSRCSPVCLQGRWGKVGTAAAKHFVKRERLRPAPPLLTLPRSDWPELGHMAAPAARELGKRV